MVQGEQPGSTRATDEVIVPQQRTAPAREQVREEVTAGRAEADARWDRVRWGPVWAGAVVAVSTFIVLQLLFFALGWLDLGFNGPNSVIAAAIVTGVLLIIAFFVGGLTTGGSITWRGRPIDAVLNGVLVWALAVAVIVAAALVSGTSVVGSLGQVIIGPGPQVIDAARLLSTARQTAGWSALFLGLTVAAAAVGAAVGSKEAIWSKRTAASRTSA